MGRVKYKVWKCRNYLYLLSYFMLNDNLNKEKLCEQVYWVCFEHVNFIFCMIFWKEYHFYAWTLHKMWDPTSEILLFLFSSVIAGCLIPNRKEELWMLHLQDSVWPVPCFERTHSYSCSKWTFHLSAVHEGEFSLSLFGYYIKIEVLLQKYKLPLMNVTYKAFTFIFFFLCLDLFPKII
jgi:hypothetical protein